MFQSDFESSGEEYDSQEEEVDLTSVVNIAMPVNKQIIDFIENTDYKNAKSVITEKLKAKSLTFDEIFEELNFYAENEMDKLEKPIQSKSELVEKVQKMKIKQDNLNKALKSFGAVENINFGKEQIVDVNKVIANLIWILKF